MGAPFPSREKASSVLSRKKVKNIRSRAECKDGMGLNWQRATGGSRNGGKGRNTEGKSVRRTEIRMSHDFSKGELSFVGKGRKA